jgi:hypothetical protein
VGKTRRDLPYRQSPFWNIALGQRQPQIHAELPYHRDALAPCVWMEVLTLREVSLDYFSRRPLAWEVFLAEEAVKIGEISSLGSVLCSPLTLESDEIGEATCEYTEKKGFTHACTSGHSRGRRPSIWKSTFV